MDPHGPDAGETPWLSAAQDTAWRQWMRATSMIYRYLDADLHDLGLDLAQYEILLGLSEAPERSLRMSDLASRVSYSRSRLTHTITRMEQQGRVQRVAAAHDRRGVVAVLTDEGMTLLADVAPDHVRAVRRVFIDVVSPDDLAALQRATSAVMAAASSARVEASPSTRRGSGADVPD